MRKELLALSSFWPSACLICLLIFWSDLCLGLSSSQTIGMISIGWFCHLVGHPGTLFFVLWFRTEYGYFGKGCPAVTGQCALLVAIREHRVSSQSQAESPWLIVLSSALSFSIPLTKLGSCFNSLPRFYRCDPGHCEKVTILISKWGPGRLYLKLPLLDPILWHTLSHFLNIYMWF